MTDDIADLADLDPEKIVQEARASFSMDDWLGGIKTSVEKITLFRDSNAVDQYVSLNSKAQALVDAAGKVDLTKEGSEERHATLIDRYTELEEELEEAKEAMLQSAATFHLKAYPNIAVKVARREARKAFADRIKINDPDASNDIAEWMDYYLLGQAIVDIVDANGAHAILDADVRKVIGKRLSDDLPPSQWQRLHDTFLRLTLTDQIATAGVEDPGF